MNCREEEEKNTKMRQIYNFYFLSQCRKQLGEVGIERIIFAQHPSGKSLPKLLNSESI